MKLAFSLYRYFPHGGLQRDMLATAEMCQERGHEVIIFCHSWEGPQPAGVVVELVATKGFGNSTKMKSFSEVVQLKVKEQKFDLVVGFNKTPGLDVYFAADTCFAYKANIERGPLYRMAKRTKDYLRAEKSVFGVESKTHILEISLNEREKFIQCYGTSENRFHLLPPGVSRNRVMPENHAEIRDKCRRSLGVSEDYYLLLALGSGFKTKGVNRSIEALSVLNKMLSENVQLIVVGNDNPKEFEKLASQLGVADKVNFLGGRDDVPALMQAADVLVHPAYRENTGGVLVEAGVAGLPVVVTDICGYAHYISENNLGKVVASPFDQKMFNQAVLDILAAPREQWQKAGQLFAAQDEIFSMHLKAVEIIEQLGRDRGVH